MSRHRLQRYLILRNAETLHQVLDECPFVATDALDDCELGLAGSLGLGIDGELFRRCELDGVGLGGWCRGDGCVADYCRV